MSLYYFCVHENFRKHSKMFLKLHNDLRLFNYV